MPMIALILCFNYSYRTQQYFLLLHMSINFAVSAFILRCRSVATGLKKKSDGRPLRYSPSHSKTLQFTAHKKLR